MGFLKRKTFVSVRTNPEVFSILSCHHYKELVCPQLAVENSVSASQLRIRIASIYCSFESCHFRRIICFSLVLFICLSNCSVCFFFFKLSY